MKDILKTIHVYTYKVYLLHTGYLNVQFVLAPTTYPHDMPTVGMPKLKNVHITLILLYKQDFCLINNVGV